MENNEDCEACWICLEGADGAETHPGPLHANRLIKPCRCPRVVHSVCLAKWQLSQSGKSEEKFCRFCRERLPDWQSHLALPGMSAVEPVMSVHFNGATHLVRVRPGEEGRQAFIGDVRRLLRLRDSQEFSITFECKVPGHGMFLDLKGLSSYDAAVFCAAMTAVERQRLAANKAANNTNASTELPSGGGGGPGTSPRAHGGGGGDPLLLPSCTSEAHATPPSPLSPAGTSSTSASSTSTSTTAGRNSRSSSSGSTTGDQVAVGDSTAPSSRQPPLILPPPAAGMALSRRSATSTSAAADTASAAAGLVGSDADASRVRPLHPSAASLSHTPPASIPSYGSGVVGGSPLEAMAITQTSSSSSASASAAAPPHRRQSGPARGSPPDGLNWCSCDGRSGEREDEREGEDGEGEGEEQEQEGVNLQAAPTTAGRRLGASTASGALGSAAAAASEEGLQQQPPAPHSVADAGARSLSGPLQHPRTPRADGAAASAGRGLVARATPAALAAAAAARVPATGWDSACEVEPAPPAAGTEGEDVAAAAAAGDGWEGGASPPGSAPGAAAGGVNMGRRQHKSSSSSLRQLRNTVAAQGSTGGGNGGAPAVATALPPARRSGNCSGSAGAAAAWLGRWLLCGTLGGSPH